MIGQLLLWSKSELFIVDRWESRLKISQQHFFFPLNPGLLPPVGAEPAAPRPDWEWLLFPQHCPDVTGTDIFPLNWENNSSTQSCREQLVALRHKLPMATEGESEGSRWEGGG